MKCCGQCQQGRHVCHTPEACEIESPEESKSYQDNLDMLIYSIVVGVTAVALIALLGTFINKW